MPQGQPLGFLPGRPVSLEAEGQLRGWLGQWKFSLCINSFLTVPSGTQWGIVRWQNCRLGWVRAPSFAYIHTGLGPGPEATVPHVWVQEGQGSKMWLGEAWPGDRAPRQL